MPHSTHLTKHEIQPEERHKTCVKKCLSSCWHAFNLDGHISYAFAYGSWEIIRARKVGTTHTKVDYVVYRLFYPVVLIGVCLFSVVAENNLIGFFSLLEVWLMLLQIIYGFIFLQNVLGNNIYRENVKHRQKIPERLVVTNEIEKGGHKFYICKRYSILPTEKLYYTERFIWLLFNILATCGVGNMLAYTIEIVQLEFENNKDHAKVRAYTMGLLMLADVILTPIPMHFFHFVFPLVFYWIHDTYLYILYAQYNIIVYSTIDRRTISETVILIRMVSMAILLISFHGVLTGLAALRDYIISLLDDSRTPMQQQHLRSQKRLARRRLMNYIEGPDGRVTGITLERRNFVPDADEYIKTEKKQHKKKQGLVSSEDDGSSEDEKLEEIKMFGKAEAAGGDVTDVALTGRQVAEGSISSKKSDMIPITAKVKPPPPPRYQVTPENDENQFSSSSSPEDEMEAIQNTIKNLPNVPRDTRVNVQTSKERRASKIPVPLHQFGELVKPRDSKENIHHRLDTAGDSPPTPPFVTLVQTLIKINKETKEELDFERKVMKEQGEAGEGRTIHTTSGSALVKVVRVVRTDDERKEEKGRTLPRAWLRTRAMLPRTNLAGDVIRPTVQKRVPIKRKRLIRRPRRVEATEDDAAIDRLINAAISTKLVAMRKEQERKEAEEANLIPRKQPRISLDSQGRPIYPRVVHINGQNIGKQEPGKPNPSMLGFHRELTDKLQKERNKRMGVPEKDARKGQKPAPVLKQKKLKGILKRRGLSDGSDGEYLLDERIKRRANRLIRRREERTHLGKRGKPVYDPLSVPESENEGAAKLETSTTFHYLGTRLKGEKFDRTTVPKDEVPLYKTHPGIGTTDDAETNDGNRKRTVERGKNLVAFHPLVQYFNVNEVAPPARTSSDKKKLG